MPLSKRILYQANAYAPAELLGMDISPSTVLDDANMAKTIGVLQQINNLAMFAAEIFDNLARLGEDTHIRVKDITIRSKGLLKQMSSVELKVKQSEVAVVEDDVKMKHAMKKVPYIPTVFTKRTNSVQINAQYSICTLPPQLWKLEAIIPDDCMIVYSNPGTDSTNSY